MKLIRSNIYLISEFIQSKLVSTTTDNFGRRKRFKVFFFMLSRRYFYQSNSIKISAFLQYNCNYNMNNFGQLDQPVELVFRANQILFL